MSTRLLVDPNRSSEGTEQMSLTATARRTLVVLALSATAACADEIRAITVLVTIVNGLPAFCADPELCPSTGDRRIERVPNASSRTLKVTCRLAAHTV